MLYFIYEFWRDAIEAERLSGAEGWAHQFRFLNLFQYITFRAAAAVMVSFLISLLIGDWVIRRLISLKVGQPVRSKEEVHKLFELHGAKAGTPTMGGIMIIGTVLLTTFLCARFLNPFVVVTAFALGALGLLGFVDDYKKVVLKSSDGVSARQKLLWQFVVALIISLFIFFKPEIAGDGVLSSRKGFLLNNEVFKISEFTFPLFKTAIIDLSYLAIPAFIVIIIGASNAVNLTDGLDGLATGCTITVTLAYSIIAFLAGHFFMANQYLFIPHNPMIGELAVFLMALMGASFGFLWFNCFPAKVFMGDTGSLAIGGALGTAAICTRQEFLLVIIGGVFVAEAVSVILQVGSYKTRKKRIFRMAPIHHHFELGGWKESQVIVRFWTISIFLALFGLALLKIV